MSDNPRYKLHLMSAAGVKFAEVTDFRALSYTRQVNAPGVLRAELDGNHSALAGLEHRSQIEVWRRDPRNAVDWYRDFVALYWAQRRTVDEKETFTLTAPGQMTLLATRRVAWYANTSNRSAFVGAAAETMMKTLVDYNVGGNATVVNGRLRAGTITGLSVEVDATEGNFLDWYCAYDNLLETLQKLARIGGGDFDLVKTGANTTQFRWYTGQLGTDRTATVIFALKRGNMGNVVYSLDRSGEATAAIVGGQGKNNARAIVIRSGADYAANNDVETFVQATNAATTAGLEDAGDRALDEKRARERFSFSVLQTPACLYGKHYFLGDLVTVVNPFSGASSTRKVLAATVTLQPDGAEAIGIVAETV